MVKTGDGVILAVQLVKESFSQANIGLQYTILKKRAYQMLIGAHAGPYIFM